MTICVKLEFDKQTYNVWLMEILETFPQMFSFRKLRIKKNGGKGTEITVIIQYVEIWSQTKGTETTQHEEL